jgi:hypothetical protein
MNRPLVTKPTIPDIAFCAEKQQLLEEFTSCIHALVTLQDQQLQALIGGDEDFERFDVLIHLAAAKKREAKYAYLAHTQAHGCQAS